MAGSYIKLIIIGNLGRDPETRMLDKAGDRANADGEGEAGYGAAPPSSYRPAATTASNMEAMDDIPF